MQIRTILYQCMKTLIKNVFLLNFTYELLMSFRMLFVERLDFCLGPYPSNCEDSGSVGVIVHLSHTIPRW